jgi:phospholipid transport system substrate-binding protein
MDLRIVRVATLAFMLLGAPSAFAQAATPEVLVQRVSTDVLAAVKADASIQAGDIDRIAALVDTKVLPYLDFERMTAAATGPRWAEATPEQKKALQEGFRNLLIRVYAGTLAQARDRTIEVLPGSDATPGREAEVRTVLRGGNEIQRLAFRLADSSGSWKVHDLNVGGVWLVEVYRGSFEQELAKGGIDGLIATLRAKGKGAGRR